MDEYRKDSGDLKAILDTGCWIMDYETNQCILLSRIKYLFSKKILSNTNS